MPQIILASTSRYRRELLERLRPAVRDAVARTWPKTALAGEGPGRDGRPPRACESQSIADRGAVVIGSDQVASLDERVLRKPGTPDVAVAQLRACQGKVVLFHTAVAVIATDSGETLDARRSDCGAVSPSRRRRARTVCSAREPARLRGQLQSRRARRRAVRANLVGRPDGADRPTADLRRAGAQEAGRRSAAATLDFERRQHCFAARRAAARSR